MTKSSQSKNENHLLSMSSDVNEEPNCQELQHVPNNVSDGLQNIYSQNTS